MQEADSIEANNVFAVAFQNYWGEILTTSDIPKMPAIMSLIMAINNLSLSTEPSKISIQDWAMLLKQSTLSDIAQVKQHLFSKCATQFLNKTLHAMKAEDLIDLEVARGGKFQKIMDCIRYMERSIDSSETPGAAVVDAVHPQQELESATKLTTIPSTDATLPEIQQEIKENLKPVANNAVVDRETKHSKKDVKAVDIKRFADKVTTLLQSDSDVQQYLVEDIGEGYSQLHSFISMAAGTDEFFPAILSTAAQMLKVADVNQSDFFVQYIATLTIDDLSHLTNTEEPRDAYELACVVNDRHLASWLFSQGREVGLYGCGDYTPSLFEKALKHNATEVIHYLLTEQHSIKIDWYNVLSLATKYANGAALKAIDDYIHSAELPIPDVRDKGQGTGPHSYNILNKAVYNLVKLWDVVLSSRASPETKSNAISKVPQLCKCIQIMIDEEKIDYVPTNSLVRTTIFELLQRLVQDMHKITATQEVESAALAIDATNVLKGKIISKYESFNLEGSEIKIAIARLKDLEDQDNCSNASCFTRATHISALSGIEHWVPEKEALGTTSLNSEEQ